LSCTLSEVLSDYDSVEVTALLSGGNRVSITMKQDDFKELNLKKGDTAWVSFNPSNALLAI